MSMVIESYGITAGKAACFGAVVLGGAGFLVAKYIANHRLHAKVSFQRNKEKEIMTNFFENLQIYDLKRFEEIERLSPEEIIEAAQQGKWSPADILHAFLYKACLSTQKTNSVTSIIVNAQEKARALAAMDCPDDKLLFGLPVSLKESMKTEGMASTIGLTCLLDKVADDDCVLAKVLYHCGAIPFVKTNIPQLMLSFASSNPIYGETSHPLRQGFAPGGSSSGEGALVGDGASPLGFGTDIAGSIRVPSHLCGICGLKPTMGRISKLGIESSTPGQTLVCATLGPMARNVSTLTLTMKALLCPLMFSLDPCVPPMPFDEKVYKSTTKLRIGFYLDDGYNEPIPAVKRAVELAKQALQEAGHCLVPFEVPKVAEAMTIVTAALFADGGKSNMKRVSKDMGESRLRGLYRKLRWPSIIRKVISFCLGFQSPRIAQDLYLHGGEDTSVARLWNLEVEASKYKKRFFDAWSESNLDAVICPPYPIASGPYKHFEDMTALMSYVVLYNLLNCPAGVVPVTTVTQDDVDGLRDYKGHYGDSWDANIKEACTDSVGMPVGVQCVAKPWQDELCLRVMEELESHLAKI